jgi:serine/threonine-protein kinase
MDTDQNLLFGVLALQADLLDPTRFAEACSAWAAHKDTPLADLLVSRGWLTAEERGHVMFLLDCKLKRHRGDARAGLAEVTTDEVRHSLAGVPDVDVRQSLAGLISQPRGHVLVATTDHVPEARDRYTLSRLHATGGIGRIWLAHDANLGRDVALKELRPERVGHPAVWARFLREARITGQLEHPGIVPIYEVNRRPDDQGPFYTMRFVRGRTLAEAVARYHRKRAHGEVGPLELRELLTAFMGVCQAVAYANSRGVLHRDLKPQNVVLGDYGEVIVLDWGMARLLGQPDAEVDAALPPVGVEGDGAETMQGQVLGTPAYMAPEQAEGRLDQLGPATDVYGLGAILYEVLTSRPPFTGADTIAVLRQVLHDDPPRPREVVAGTSAALEAVCLKALAKKAAERYDSAKELAGEVQHWLADEPVEAYGEPFTARAARWARRHRTGVAAAAAILLSTVVALAVSAALIWREERRTAEQKVVAQREWARAERERDRAGRNFDTARTLILDLSQRIQALETGWGDPRLTDLARQAALEKARSAFDQFRVDLPDDARVQMQAANVHRYAANVARLVNDHGAAEKAYAASLRIWEELAGRYPDQPVYRDNLAQTVRDQAMFHKRVGRLLEATAALDRAAGLAEGLHGQLNESSYQRTRGTILLDRADVEHLRGQFAAAEQSARQAVDLLDLLKGAPSKQASPLDPLLAAMAVHLLALSQREQGKTTEALESHEDAVGRVRALTGPKAGRGVRYWDHEARRERAKTWASLADRRAAAVEDLDGVIQGAEKLVEDYPHDPLVKDGLAVAYLRRGELCLLLGQMGPAAADLDKSLALSRQVIDRYGEMSAYLGTRGQTFLALGRLAVASGKPVEAAERFKNAASVFRIALRQDPENYHHRRTADEIERESIPSKP